jgi:hypothetical protein
MPDVIHSQSQVESLPFLLVRAGETDDEVDEDMVTTEIPSARSVPPHAPPARVVTSETELPTIIVELKDQEMAEPERVSAVEGLLTESAKFALNGEPRSTDATPGERSQAARGLSKSSKSRRGKARGVAIALVAALSAVGGTVAGMKVFHVSGAHLTAALHVVR